MAAGSKALLRWQRDAHRVLGEFLAAATQASLPAVTWTIAVTGALVADVDSLTSTPAEARAAFDTWAAKLGAKVAPERVDSGGAIHLYASFKVTDGFDAGGAIRATIYPDLEDEVAS